MIVVITGASKGLGKAFAEQFAANNILLLCARNETVLNATAAGIKNKIPSTTIYTKAVDLSVKEDVIAFAKWCLQFGAPDILINNAGNFIQGSVYNEPDGVLEEMLNINLMSAYYLSKTLLPNIIANTKNNNKHIFNICSIASLQAYANGGSYSISKFALLGFSKNLREELKPFNIKVTAVMPGAVYTDSWAGIDENRIMQTSDIAKLVYTASQLSPQACVEDIVIRPQLGDL
ncbi:MAG: SDR family NAD(P)-dependent oxidoreductase [Bacteroidetes bacterium]|nr:SDR family NAD(P)-dependent oxidoreductase [Bacteroidota bacterium]MBS1641717.1 SDR family NAD(P)-dependent oxidoreductase [Bacteroidota bacterium]MBS1671208.1 SDR family NAD(P)-dependent oxidoreductase [Bacteroidota bacterium]